MLKEIHGTIFIKILSISLFRMTCHQEKLSYKCRNRREFCGCITFEIIVLTYIEVLKCGKIIRIRSKTRNKMLIYGNRYACDICKLVHIRIGYVTNHPTRRILVMIKCNVDNNLVYSIYHDNGNPLNLFLFCIELIRNYKNEGYEHKIY